MYGNFSGPACYVKPPQGGAVVAGAAGCGHGVEGGCGAIRGRWAICRGGRGGVGGRQPAAHVLTDPPQPRFT
eukprot:CAMPEP_0173368644 /NCGR_PEP_ID=MMETSP1144-20121109/25613_1 /TAXON_ID=483371 /ORGANISM="non described non described, Strain CCMP2298" /LENGTH=71 /DNA_ID=CAMNT_0014319843 /DNA_START=39 /DNA_END=250 /DNA_ORIENTATION=+